MQRHEYRHNNSHGQHDTELQVQHGGAFNADDEGFAVGSSEHGAHVIEGEWEGEPDGQTVQGQEAENGEERHGDVAADEQEGVEVLTEFEAETHGQGAFRHGQIVLVVAHIVHIQDGRDQEADGDTGSEGAPRPARDLHIIGTPGHQEAHSEKDQDIAQAATGELERASAIEVGDEHSSKPEQENNGTNGKNEVQAKQGSDNETGDATAEHLVGGHLLAKDHRHRAERASVIEAIAVVEVLVEVVRADLQKQAGEERDQEGDDMERTRIGRNGRSDDYRTDGGSQRKGSTGLEPYAPGSCWRSGCLNIIHHRRCLSIGIAIQAVSSTLLITVTLQVFLHSVGMGLASIRVPITQLAGRMDARPIPTDELLIT